MSALIYCPFPDETAARAAAKVLLEERLVACANIGAAIVSLYHWDGAIAESAEIPVLFKTTAATLGAAIERLETLHPYDTPAIMGWSCDIAGKAATQWLRDAVEEGAE